MVFLILLAALIGGAGALTAFFEAATRRNLYQPTPWLGRTPARYGIPHEEAILHTSDGLRLHGWYFPVAGARATILFCHGNGYNIGDLFTNKDGAQGFRYLLESIRCNFLLFDYRGYGLSQGRPTEKGTYRDAAAALAYLRSRPDIDQDRIVLYGFSLGTAVVVELAAREPCAALILRAPFTSVRELAQTRYPALGILFRLVPWLPLSRYDSATKIAQVRVPVLVMHGELDATVPIWMGKRLYQLAPGPKQFVTLWGADHSDLPLEQMTAAINNFLDGLELA